MLPSALPYLLPFYRTGYDGERVRDADGNAIVERREWGHDYKCTHRRRKDALHCSTCKDTAVQRARLGNPTRARGAG